MIRGMGLYGPDRVVAETVAGAETDSATLTARLTDLRTRCAALPGGFVWLGLFEPVDAELDLITTVFGLSRLLVDDAANAQQRAKFEIDRDGHGLVVMKTLDYVDATSDIHTGQLAVFVGVDFVITVRYGQIGDLSTLRQRVGDEPRLREHGPYGVLYAVLDLVVDGYLAVVEEVGADIENLETEVFAGDPTVSTANSIYRLKRETVEARRAIVPLYSWAQDAVAERVPWTPDLLRPYFRDIGDHLLRAMDSVESADNLLMTLLMAATSLQDLQQNRDMRKISAWVAIAAVPTAVAAIYGMNFDDMPELHWRMGYPVVLAVMATACVFLFRAFKRSGWL